MEKDAASLSGATCTGLNGPSGGPSRLNEPSEVTLGSAVIWVCGLDIDSAKVLSCMDGGIVRAS